MLRCLSTILIKATIPYPYRLLDHVPVACIQNSNFESSCVILTLTFNFSEHTSTNIWHRAGRDAVQHRDSEKLQAKFGPCIVHVCAMNEKLGMKTVYVLLC